MKVDSEGGIWLGYWDGGRIERFTPDGVSDFRIPMPARKVTTLALGGSIDVPTLGGGTATLTIPEGTPAGKTFRLKAKGIESVRSQVPGDLFCHVVVETPVQLTERQRQLLREFESLSSADSARHNPRAKGWLDKVKEFFEG